MKICWRKFRTWCGRRSRKRSNTTHHATTPLPAPSSELTMMDYGERPNTTTVLMAPAISSLTSSPSQQSQKMSSPPPDQPPPPAPKTLSASSSLFQRQSELQRSSTVQAHCLQSTSSSNGSTDSDDLFTFSGPAMDGGGGGGAGGASGGVAMVSEPWLQVTNSIDSNTDSGDSITVPGLRNDGGSDEAQFWRAMEPEALRQYIRKRYLATAPATSNDSWLPSNNISGAGSTDSDDGTTTVSGQRKDGGGGETHARRSNERDDIRQYIAKRYLPAILTPSHETWVPSTTSSGGSSDSGDISDVSGLTKDAGGEETLTPRSIESDFLQKYVRKTFLTVSPVNSDEQESTNPSTGSTDSGDSTAFSGPQKDGVDGARRSIDRTDLRQYVRKLYLNAAANSGKQRSAKSAGGSVDSGDSSTFSDQHKDGGASETNSRRSIERDDVRKYVRKRYLIATPASSDEQASTNSSGDSSDSVTTSLSMVSERTGGGGGGSETLSQRSGERGNLR